MSHTPLGTSEISYIILGKISGTIPLRVTQPVVGPEESNEKPTDSSYIVDGHPMKIFPSEIHELIGPKPRIYHR